MDFIQNILQYYHTESRHGFTGAVLGAILLIAGLLLWRLARPLSLLKGLSLPLLVFSLVFGIGGFGDEYATRKALPEKLRLYRENKQAFFKEEVPKVQRTHRSWLGIRIFWGLITLTGVLLLFTTKKSYWIGVGLGTLLMGLAGDTEEAISMRFNERYYHEVLKAAKPQIITQIEEKRPDKLVPVTLQQPVNRNMPVKTSQLKFSATERDTLAILQPPLFRDTIESGRLLESTNEVLVVHELTNSISRQDVAEAPVAAKRKRLLDYYHSDLIQQNGVSPKHCWFSKKYLD